MNRALALLIVAAMVVGIVANFLLAGPNWVALIAVLIAGVAVAFGFSTAAAPTAPPADAAELESGDADVDKQS